MLTDNIYIYLLVASLTLYAIRALPLTLIKGEITNTSNIFLGPIGSTCAIVFQTGFWQSVSAVKRKSFAFPKRLSVVLLMVEKMGYTSWLVHSSSIIGNTFENVQNDPQIAKPIFMMTPFCLTDEL